MNEIRRRDGETEEMARVRDVLANQSYPEFVTGFDVQGGLFDDEPALWITFKLTGDDTIGVTEVEQRANVLLPLQDSVHADLEASGVSLFPFFRVVYAVTPHH